MMKKMNDPITKSLAVSLLVIMITGGWAFCDSREYADKDDDEIVDAYYVHPRIVELRITYRLAGIKKTPSNQVWMQEFSEEPVTWAMGKINDKPILLFYAARQREYPNQRHFEYINIEPEPDRIVSKDMDGNVIEFWDLSDNIKDGQDIVITRQFRFKAYETAFHIDPEKVGMRNPSARHASAGRDGAIMRGPQTNPYDDCLYKYYTRTQEYAELTPEVIKLAEEIIGDEANPYLQARAIYAWCINNIAYVYPPNRGILFSLPRKTGDCGEYSLIFMSLCRAVGIPVRVVNGRWCCRAKKNYHVWNEFYLPDYGWIPVDATDGRINRDHPEILAGKGDPFYFFGNLDSGRFVSSKGTSIQLYPSPPWHLWGLADTNRNPIFFQTAATVYSNIRIEKQTATLEIVKGDDVLW